VYADPNKFYSNTQFETNINSNITSGGNIPGLKSFLKNRRASVITELGANGCFMGTQDAEATENKFQVYPNPSNGQFSISGEKFPVQLQLYNSLGELILETAVNSKQEIVHLKKVNSGVYFYRILSENLPVASGKVTIE
jgi:hypothetical protein